MIKKKCIFMLLVKCGGLKANIGLWRLIILFSLVGKHNEQPISKSH